MEKIKQGKINAPYLPHSVASTRNPPAAVYHRTRSQKERNQMDPDSAVSVLWSVVPNRNPIQEALY